MKKIVIPRIILLLVFINLMHNPFIAYSQGKELAVVSHLDMKRYQGIWFEIAHNPWFVEKDCYAMVAHYKLNDEGELDIINACRKNGFHGEISKIEGTGWIVKEEEPGKLKVQFLWPFTLDYWVIVVGVNYEYAVVGEPDKENIWILSRRPYLDKDVRSQVIKDLRVQGYDLSGLIWTPQHSAYSQCFANWIELPKPKPDEPVC